MPNDITYTLSSPLTIDGQEYTQFVFKEPTVQDLLTAEDQSPKGTRHETNIALLAISAQTHINVFKQLPMPVYFDMLKAVEPFFS